MDALVAAAELQTVTVETQLEGSPGAIVTLALRFAILGAVQGERSRAPSPQLEVAEDTGPTIQERILEEAGAHDEAVPSAVAAGKAAGPPPLSALGSRRLSGAEGGPISPRKPKVLRSVRAASTGTLRSRNVPLCFIRHARCSIRYTSTVFRPRRRSRSAASASRTSPRE